MRCRIRIPRPGFFWQRATAACNPWSLSRSARRSFTRVPFAVAGCLPCRQTVLCPLDDGCKWLWSSMRSMVCSASSRRERERERERRSRARGSDRCSFGCVEEETLTREVEGWPSHLVDRECGRVGMFSAGWEAGKDVSGTSSQSSAKSRSRAKIAASGVSTSCNQTGEDGLVAGQGQCRSEWCLV